MRIADQIIDRLGGTSAVASGLGLTPSTVHSWREVNFIPAWRQPALMELARSRKTPLTESEFPTAADRRPRRPADQQAAA